MQNEKEAILLLAKPATKEQGFAALLRMYQRPIYYYIRRMLLDHDDADDVTQNTFIKAWRALDQFRGDSKFSTWLYTIAYRESLAHIEQKKKRNAVDIEKTDQEVYGVLQNDVLFTGDEIQLQLQAAMATLPEKQKSVFIMKYFEEKKYEEIAEITGTSVGALKASFHHAVQKIEAYLKRKNQF